MCNIYMCNRDTDIFICIRNSTPIFIRNSTPGASQSAYPSHWWMGKCHRLLFVCMQSYIVARQLILTGH